MTQEKTQSYHITILNHFKETKTTLNNISTSVFPDVFIPNILFTEVPDNKMNVLFKLKKKGDISFKKERGVYMLR